MIIEVMFFGQLTDITGTARLRIDNAQDTDTLKIRLFQQFPALSHSNFRIAVDNKLINVNTPIIAGSTIAFMPPFSGG
jgi:sulfur-carrier protein